jgi:hypothetical protein
MTQNGELNALTAVHAITSFSASARFPSKIDVKTRAKKIAFFMMPTTPTLHHSNLIKYFQRRLAHSYRHASDVSSEPISLELSNRLSYGPS